MKVTMTQIANAVGVSRGTVDRALHNRKGVNPAVAEEILTVARQLGYRPNFAAQTLKRQRKLTLGFVLPDGSGFWADVRTGIEQAIAEFRDCNVDIIVRQYGDYKYENELKCINEVMDLGAEGLAVVPINDPRIKARLSEITAAGVPVILVNQEFSGAAEIDVLCYIGSDYMLAGRTAAGVLKLCHHRGRIELGVFCGSRDMLSQSTRITGFLQEIDRLHLNCHLIDIVNFSLGKTDAAHNRKQASYEMAMAFLKKHPETTALFTAGGSAYSVAKAICDSGRLGEIIHITYDLNEDTRVGLENGSITALIGQESVIQGYQPMRMLFDYLFNHITPQGQRILLHNEIIIPQNAQ